MATINLGSIKFNWRGAYAGGTAYAVDDVVSSGGSSYICILASTGNATSNGTYWEQMSSAGIDGSDGTDLSTTLTTQGDIIYRNASGLARLGAGTAGEALITNGAGANPSWGSVAGGKILQVVHGSHTGQVTAQTTSYIDVGSGTNLTITPSATSSKILILAHFNECYISSSTGSTSHYLRVNNDGNTVHEMHTTYTTSLTGEEMWSQDLISVHSPNSTSALSYKLQFRGLNTNTIRINQNQATGGTTLTLMEIGA